MRAACSACLNASLHVCACSSMWALMRRPCRAAELLAAGGSWPRPAMGPSAAAPSRRRPPAAAATPLAGGPAAAQPAPGSVTPEPPLRAAPATAAPAGGAGSPTAASAGACTPAVQLRWQGQAGPSGGSGRGRPALAPAVVALASPPAAQLMSGAAAPQPRSLADLLSRPPQPPRADPQPGASGWEAPPQRLAAPPAHVPARHSAHAPDAPDAAQHPLQPQGPPRPAEPRGGAAAEPEASARPAPGTPAALQLSGLLRRPGPAGGPGGSASAAELLGAGRERQREFLQASGAAQRGGGAPGACCAGGPAPAPEQDQGLGRAAGAGSRVVGRLLLSPLSRPVVLRPRLRGPTGAGAVEAAGRRRLLHRAASRERGGPARPRGAHRAGPAGAAAGVGLAAGSAARRGPGPPPRCPRPSPVPRAAPRPQALAKHLAAVAERDGEALATLPPPPVPGTPRPALAAAGCLWALALLCRVPSAAAAPLLALRAQAPAWPRVAAGAAVRRVLCVRPQRAAWSSRC
jgi:pilus assembly protein FimV